MPIPRDQSAQRRWPDRRIAQKCSGNVGQFTKTGVESELVGSPVDHRLWKMSINAHHPRLRTATHRIIEMNNLRKAVHPVSVRPAQVVAQMHPPLLPVRARALPERSVH